MGSPKGGAPSAPSYAPQQQAALQTYQSDQGASDYFRAQGEQALGAQSAFASASGMRGEDFMQMAQDAQNWGRQQFNEIWPFAKDYLSSQQALSDLAGENASESVIVAREGRQRAADTYNRYQTEFVPLEQKFVQDALDYGSPARAAQASGQAQAAVRTAADAAERRRQDELRSYNIDPSQARYQGESAMMGLGSAAAQAGAGTASRLATDQEANRRLAAAVQLGQTLPTTALQQLSAASQTASGGLQAGQVGSGGLTAATGVLGAGTTAGGSPVAYGYMSNPYTQLNATEAGLGSNLYGYNMSALGQMGNVIGQSTQAQTADFTGQMKEFEANAAQDAAFWGGIGKAAGGVGSFLASPATGTIGSALFAGMSDRRLKTDIEKVGHVGKLPVYSFRYKGYPETHIGYMADEVEQIDPLAVIATDKGYKAVNYGRATMSALGA